MEGARQRLSAGVVAQSVEGNGMDCLWTVMGVCIGNLRFPSALRKICIGNLRFPPMGLHASKLQNEDNLKVHRSPNL